MIRHGVLQNGYGFRWFGRSGGGGEDDIQFHIPVYVCDFILS